MDSFTILNDLLRHRRALAVVLALSVLAGTLVLAKYSPPLKLESRKYTVGVARTSVLIDTPSSQVAALDPQGSGDLAARADLLSRLMVQGTLKARIAQAAGMNPNSVFGTSMSVLDPLESATPPRGAPQLTTQVLTSETAQLPLIQIETQAADAVAATKLADAAVAGLQAYIDQQAADTKVPDKRRVRITRLGVTQAVTAVRGPGHALALAVSIFVFGFGLACILSFSAIMRTWRSSSAASRSPEREDEWPVRTPADPHDHESSPAGLSSLRPADSTPPPATATPEPAAEEREPLRVAATPGKPQRAAGHRRRRSAS